MSGHRSDIDALRALAVALVIVFHMSESTLEAGFIGVDVFFVLSGFLITGILNAELDRSGSVDLGRFWARRIRRLLPASTLTLLAVVVASLWLTSPLRWEQLAQTSLAAVFYVSNFFFAGQEADYFAADVRSNPLLHYWSLSVEEQFYVIWPVVFFGLGRLGRRRSSATTAQLRLMVAAGLGLASFAYSLYLTRSNPTLAYYSPFSRAWEFLAGASLALLHGRITSGSAGSWRTNPLVRQATAVVGLVLILISLVLVSATRDFPAPSGLVPVAGTLLFIVAGVQNGDPLGRAMRFWPIQYVGRLSYSWYLWHWPFLVIGWEYLQSRTATTSLGLVAASFVVAAAAHHLVENPVRFAARLKPSPPNFALALGLIVVGLAGAGLLALRSDAELERPELQAIEAATEVWYGERLADFVCGTSDLEVLGTTCTFGDVDADRVLLALGDSNAEHWLPALDTLGKEQGFAVMLRVRGGCPVQQLTSPFTLDLAICRDMQQTTAEVVEAVQPDAVLINQISSYVEFILDRSGASASEEARRALWIEETASFLDGFEDVPVGWLHSTPINGTDPVDCLAWRDLADCETDRGEALRTAVIERAWSEEAFDQARVRPDALDLNSVLCPGDRCPVIIDDVIVYRDDNHLSVAGAELLIPELEPFIANLLG
ncbi:MAG: acyltransferase family protein [Actinomycetota bacterium]